MWVGVGGCVCVCVCACVRTCVLASLLSAVDMDVHGVEMNTFLFKF